MPQLLRLTLRSTLAPLAGCPGESVRRRKSVVCPIALRPGVHFELVVTETFGSEWVRTEVLTLTAMYLGPTRHGSAWIILLDWAAEAGWVASTPLWRRCRAL
jgi:hypothetical protein